MNQGQIQRPASHVDAPRRHATRRRELLPPALRRFQRLGYEAALANPALIRNLRVPGKNGSVPLSAVADIHEGSGPAQISRYQRQRNISLTAELNGRPLGEVMAEVQKLPSVQNARRICMT